MDPRPRTHVHDPVGGPHGLLVVFHHDEGVAQVAEPFEGADEALVVPGVEADAGLVQHVEDPGEARAHLGREPDPLGLASGEGVGRPVQGEVVQAHVHQEAEPLHDLPEDGPGDLGLEGGRVFSRPWKNARASRTGRAETSAMFLPATFTERTSRLYRVPPQAGQGLKDMKPSRASRTPSESDSW